MKLFSEAVCKFILGVILVGIMIFALVARLLVLTSLMPVCRYKADKMREGFLKKT